MRKRNNDGWVDRSAAIFVTASATERRGNHFPLWVTIRTLTYRQRASNTLVRRSEEEAAAKRRVVHFHAAGQKPSPLGEQLQQGIEI